MNIKQLAELLASSDLNRDSIDLLLTELYLDGYKDGLASDNGKLASIIKESTGIDLLKEQAS